MDYVSNEITIAKDTREDKAAALLSYDVAFAAMKKKKRRQKTCLIFRNFRNTLDKY